MLTRAGGKFFMVCTAVLMSASAAAYEITSHDLRTPVLLSGDHVFTRSIGIFPYERGSIYARAPTTNISSVKGSRPIPGISPASFAGYAQPNLLAVAMNVNADLPRNTSKYRNRRSDATDYDREKKHEARASEPDASGSGPGIWAMLVLGFTFGCHQIRRKARAGGVRFTSQ